MYTLAVSAENNTGGTTNGVWQRLMPVSNMGSIIVNGKPTGADSVAVEINVNTLSAGECKLRLVRKPSSSGNDNNDTIVDGDLKVYQYFAALRMAEGGPAVGTLYGQTSFNEALFVGAVRACGCGYGCACGLSGAASVV